MTDGIFDGDIARVSDGRLISNDLEDILTSEDSTLRWFEDSQKDDHTAENVKAYSILRLQTENASKFRSP